MIPNRCVIMYKVSQYPLGYRRDLNYGSIDIVPALIRDTFPFFFFFNIDDEDEDASGEYASMQLRQTFDYPRSDHATLSGTLRKYLVKT